MSAGGMTIVRRIGFIDDNHVMRQLMSRLNEAHHSPAHLMLTAKAQDAIGWVRDGVLDVLIADLNLGEESGLEILQRARRINKSLRLVLYTTQTAAGRVSGELADIDAKHYEKHDGLVDMMDEVFGINVDDGDLNIVGTPDLEHEMVGDIEFERSIAETFANHIRESRDLTAKVLSGPDSFSLAELLDDVLKLRPRGKKYIRAWLRANLSANRDE
ncbi:MAG: hypothetical protein JWM95_339 [Gemmatimonadetes bacterium]|nr:hypothetical protein [Gemmatimonadota bacterium]